MSDDKDTVIRQLNAHIDFIETRLAHATEFRYGNFTVRLEKRTWHVRSDYGATHVTFDGPDAKDEAIREAAKRHGK